MKERFSTNRPPQPGVEAPPTDQGGAREPNRRRQVPPENTSAEAFYYVKQMTNHTAMVVVLDNGTELRGHIEWYDRNCIKVNREGNPNLLVYKHAIKYMFKQEEETPAG
jgi:RNA chaperone Hfq